MTRVIAIIQARLGSTRLPGKVLLDVCGKTVLERVVERTRYTKNIDSVVVTMPNGERDDLLAQFCEEHKIHFLRGREEDLLDQYYQAAKTLNAEVIVRITADCPLIDPQIIDQTINEYFARNCDYISTGRLSSTFPDGLDTEVFSFATLEEAWKKATLQSEREHVTPYIWNHPELFKVETVNNDIDLSLLRWTVDEQRDLDFVRRVYQEFNTKEIFYMKDIIRFLEENPEIGMINNDILRNSGYYKSLKQESPSI